MNTKSKRSPWPYAIIGTFVIFGAFVASYIVWACHQNEDLVAENYYDNEVKYQDRLDQLNHAQALAIPVVVAYDKVGRNIVITFPASQSRTATGLVHLYRPSDASLDRDVPLAVGADGVQRLDARAMRKGLWKVRVEWSSGGAGYFLDQRLVIPSGQS